MTTPEVAQPTWRKSTYSGSGNGDCVEVAYSRTAVHVRDTKDRNGGTLTLPQTGWHAFVSTLATRCPDPSRARDGRSPCATDRRPGTESGARAPHQETGRARRPPGAPRPFPPRQRAPIHSCGPARATAR